MPTGIMTRPASGAPIEAIAAVMRKKTNGEQQGIRADLRECAVMNLSIRAVQLGDREEERDFRKQDHDGEREAAHHVLERHVR